MLCLCFNNNFWTLKKMRLFIRCLCVFLKKLFSEGAHVLPWEKIITLKTQSEMFFNHSLPSLLCSFSFPCSSSVSFRISSWTILNLFAICSTFLSMQFCDVLSFSMSSLWDWNKSIVSNKTKSKSTLMTLYYFPAVQKPRNKNSKQNISCMCIILLGWTIYNWWYLVIFDL